MAVRPHRGAGVVFLDRRAIGTREYLLTSNKWVAEWGAVLGAAVIAAAVLDRLIHHRYVINIRGESYRLGEKKRAGWAPVSPLAPRGERGEASSQG